MFKNLKQKVENIASNSPLRNALKPNVDLLEVNDANSVINKVVTNESENFDVRKIELNSDIPQFDHSSLPQNVQLASLTHPLTLDKVEETNQDVDPSNNISKKSESTIKNQNETDLDTRNVERSNKSDFKTISSLVEKNVKKDINDTKNFEKTKVENNYEIDYKNLSRDQFIEMVEKLKHQAQMFKQKYKQSNSQLSEKEKEYNNSTFLLNRRIKELKEQIELDSSAKRDIESNYMFMLEEKDEKINVLKTQIRLLKGDKNEQEQHSVDDIIALKEKVKRFEGLLNKCRETIKLNKEAINKLTTEKQNIYIQLDSAKQQLQSYQDNPGDELLNCRQEIERLRLEIQKFNSPIKNNLIEATNSVDLHIGYSEITNMDIHTNDNNISMCSIDQQSTDLIADTLFPDQNIQTIKAKIESNDMILEQTDEISLIEKKKVDDDVTENVKQASTSNPDNEEVKVSNITESNKNLSDLEKLLESRSRELRDVMEDRARVRKELADQRTRFTKVIDMYNQQLDEIRRENLVLTIDNKKLFLELHSSNSGCIDHINNHYEDEYAIGDKSSNNEVLLNLENSINSENINSSLKYDDNPSISVKDNELNIDLSNVDNVANKKTALNNSHAILNDNTIVCEINVDSNILIGDNKDNSLSNDVIFLKTLINKMQKERDFLMRKMEEMSRREGDLRQGMEVLHSDSDAIVEKQRNEIVSLQQLCDNLKSNEKLLGQQLLDTRSQCDQELNRANAENEISMKNLFTMFQDTQKDVGDLYSQLVETKETSERIIGDLEQEIEDKIFQLEQAHQEIQTLNVILETTSLKMLDNLQSSTIKKPITIGIDSIDINLLNDNMNNKDANRTQIEYENMEKDELHSSNIVANIDSLNANADQKFNKDDSLNNNKLDFNINSNVESNCLNLSIIELQDSITKSLSYEKEISSLNLEKEEFLQQIKQLKEEIKQRNDLELSIKNDFQNLYMENNSLLQKIKELQCPNLKVEQIDIVLNRNKFESEYESLNNQQSDNRIGNDENLIENQKLITELESKIEVLSKDFQKLKLELQTLTIALERKTQENDDLLKEMEELKLNRINDSENFEIISNEKETLTSELNLLRIDLEKEQFEKDTNLHRLKLLESSFQQSNEENLSMKSDYEKLIVERDDLLHRMEMMVFEKDQAARGLDTLEKLHCDELNTQQISLSQKIQQLEADNILNQKELLSLNKNILDLEEQKKTDQQTIDQLKTDLVMTQQIKNQQIDRAQIIDTENQQINQLNIKTEQFESGKLQTQQLEADIIKYKQIISQLESDEMIGKEKINLLEKDIIQNKVEISELKCMIVNNEEKIKQFDKSDKNNLDKIKQLTDDQSNFKNNVQTLENSKIYLETKNQQLENEAHSFKIKIDELENDKIKAQNTLKDHQNTIQQWEEKHNNLLIEKKKFQEEINKLTLQIGSQDVEYIAKFDKENEKFLNERLLMQQKIYDLENDKIKAQNTFAGCEKTIQQWEDKHNNLLDENKKFTEKINSLNLQIESQNAEHIAKFDKEKETFLNEKLLMQQKIDEIQKENCSMDSKFNELKQKCKQSFTKNKELSKQIIVLQEEIDSSKLLKIKYDEYIQSWNAEKVELTTNITFLKDKLKSIEREKEQLIDELNSNNIKNASQSENIKQFQNDKMDLEKQNIRLENECKELLIKYEKINDDYVLILSDKNTLSSKIAELEENKKSNFEMVSNISQLELQNVNLINENLQIKSQLDESKISNNFVVEDLRKQLSTLEIEHATILKDVEILNLKLNEFECNNKSLIVNNNILNEKITYNSKELITSVNENTLLNDRLITLEKDFNLALEQKLQLELDNSKFGNKIQELENKEKINEKETNEKIRQLEESCKEAFNEKIALIDTLQNVQINYDSVLKENKMLNDKLKNQDDKIGRKKEKEELKIIKNELSKSEKELLKFEKLMETHLINIEELNNKNVELNSQLEQLKNQSDIKVEKAGSLEGQDKFNKVDSHPLFKEHINIIGDENYKEKNTEELQNENSKLLTEINLLKDKLFNSENLYNDCLIKITFLENKCNFFKFDDTVTNELLSEDAMQIHKQNDLYSLLKTSDNNINTLTNDTNNLQSPHILLNEISISSDLNIDNDSRNIPFMHDNKNIQSFDDKINFKVADSPNFQSDWWSTEIWDEASNLHSEKELNVGIELSNNEMNMKKESLELKNSEKETDEEKPNYQKTKFLTEEMTEKNRISIQETEILRRELDYLRNHISQDAYSHTFHQPTEHEYLKNILYEYMMGKETKTLAKVLCSILKFNESQTDSILQKEEERQQIFPILRIHR